MARASVVRLGRPVLDVGGRNDRRGAGRRRDARAQNDRWRRLASAARPKRADRPRMVRRSAVCPPEATHALYGDRPGRPGRRDRSASGRRIATSHRRAALAGETVRSPEGCLSIPGKIDTAVRRERVVLRYRDGQSGKRRREYVSGFTAVVFQHEIDHLNGILFIDRTPDRAAGNRRHKSSKP